MIYVPQEDSYLLEEEVRRYAKGRVLDMGTGSGIQAVAAASRKQTSSVLAVDIQDQVISHCRAKISEEKIRFQKSDLFANVKGRFDTIIFNPPYLPADRRDPDITIDGGKKGNEIILRFIRSLPGYLAEEGFCMLLFSSKSGTEKIEEAMRHEMLEWKIIAKKHISFEDIFILRIWKSDIRQEVEHKGIKEIKYLAHGKRGVAFTGTYKGYVVTIKIKKPDSHARERMRNEAQMLRILNQRGIGPKLIFSGQDYLVYRFVEGGLIDDYISTHAKEEILRMLHGVFSQLYMMDSLGIQKEEMHRPKKHIYIQQDGKPVMIDFERCFNTNNPSNVTQFCQYIRSKSGDLSERGIRIDTGKLGEAAAAYKKDKERFGVIMELIK